jgi:hypothetical protein
VVAPALEAFALLVGAGALLGSVGGTLHARRWARAPLPKTEGPFPRAAVIVPCKGAHPGFEANVRAFAAQHYPAYDLLFVVDAKDDPCALALDALQGSVPRVHVALIDPDLAAEGWASGKIAAQLTGVALAAPDVEVLVFADADAHPEPGWLASLVAPLADPAVGGVTGYRWYAPATRATAWTHLRDAWNAVGLDALTMPRFRFLWGGSMAVRRADFERSRVRALWKQTVSEDVGLTRAILELGLHLEFAPGAMVASREDWSGAEVREWVVRQAALTRGAMPNLFLFAGIVYPLSLALVAAGLALALAWPSAPLGLAGLAMLAPVLSAAPRAWYREALVLRVLPAARRPWRDRAAHLAFSVAMPLVMLPVLAKARRVRAIAWRGRTYPLAPTERRQA